MKEIPLTQGYVALVDDKDYERVMQYDWRANVQKTVTYAYRTIWDRATKTETAIYLHRFVFDPEAKKKVDHIDHNGLNCQGDNLRPATHQENIFNQGPRKNATSRYKGVQRIARKTKTSSWRAAISLSGCTYYIGIFASEEEAALAYNYWATLLFGEFAYLNVIPEPLRFAASRSPKVLRSQAKADARLGVNARLAATAA